MPKAERGTPKDIANRMKAKGLQKLKFYCQMCEKQCRDENGFKCHMTSESHLRNMKFLSENAGSVLDNMSRQFESVYVDTLRRRHGTKRMNANQVYQEVIQDKHHVHMNATRWTTLSGFVQYLGKKGICTVEETERGWYVTYIERDAGLLARNEAMNRRAEAEKIQERKVAKRMEIQRIEAAKALDRAGGTVQVEASMIGDLAEQPNLNLNVSLTAIKKKKTAAKVAQAAKSILDDGDDDDDDDDEGGAVKKNNIELKPRNTNGNRLEMKGTSRDFKGVSEKSTQPVGDKRERLNHQEEENKSSKKRRKDRDDDRRTDYWLQPDIIVRVISKKLSNYYKRKAVVVKVKGKYSAEVEVLDSGPDERDGGDILRLDQDDLETVIPKQERIRKEKVRILNGRGRGQLGKVLSLDKKRQLASLKVEDDSRILEDVPYEDFSKVI